MQPFRLALAAAVLASALIPVASQSASATDAAAISAFQQLCGATSADYDGVVKAADGAGWKAIEVLTDPMHGVTLIDKVSRSQKIGDATVKLYAMHGTNQSSSGLVNVSECMITSDKGGPGILAAAHAWLGIAPTSDDGHKASYLFAMRDGKRTPIANTDIPAAIDAGGAYLVKVSANDSMASVDMYRFVK